MSDKLDQRHVEWSLRHFQMLAEGGAWAVPRSGLIYTKRDGRLVLTAIMPFDKEMPISAQLCKQQQSEIDGIKLHFEAAGVPVDDDLKRRSMSDDPS